jgi:methyltransferase (TIGR00027 family)
MALFRALETNRPAARRLFVDRFAVEFLSPRLRRVAALSRLRPAGALLRAHIDHRWPGARTSAVARTRFIDEAAEAALGSGVAQVVLLGAGFDARAYRLGAMARAVVFEVDHPSTSGAKRKVVEGLLGSLPPHVRYVPADFGAGPLHETMAAAGYDPRRRTLFIWEGVTNYLTEPAVDGTLRWCADAAAGSQVLFTYVHRLVLENPQAFWGTTKLFATLGAAGERWTFGFDPAALPDFLERRGLVLAEDLGAADYRARYFGAAAARMRGYEFYRLAVARVLRASSSSGTTPA